MVNRTSFHCERIHCQIGIGQWTAAIAERAHIWNWGHERLDSNRADTPKTIAREFKLGSPRWWNLPIIQSLINDLHFAFYGYSFQDVVKDFLFTQLRDRADDFLNLVILRLDNMNLFETGRPISHVFADIIACLVFLRERAGMKEDRSSITDQVLEIVALREWFWHGKFGKKNFRLLSLLQTANLTFG